MLSAALDTFTTNEAFKQLFAKGDINALQKASEELYSNNRKRYGVTHFYYIDNYGICQLRMHQPDLRGDKITRMTFESAKKSNQPTSGLELGKTTYALRVISPYVDKGSQLGFVEFGEEIDHFNDVIKKETGIDVTLLGDKKLLNQEAYKGMRTRAGKPDNWTDLENHVVLGSTFNQQDYFVKTVFKDEDVKDIIQPTYFGTTIMKIRY